MRALLFGMVLALLSPAAATAGGPEVTATLDGRAIPIGEVARHDCHDLEFPAIRCFRNPADRDRSVSVQLGQLELAATSGVVYVTIYDWTQYGGSSMAISQDYDALVTIGWNDRVSSFKGRNSETGRFYVDWFHGGSSWSFCCNQQTSGLGGFDNSFSSVYRT
jgi:hypothetical protein